MPSPPKLARLSLHHLHKLHARIIVTGLHKSPSLLAQLIERYAALSHSNYAHFIITQHFHNPLHNLFLLNTLIKSSNPRHSILIFANWVSKSSLHFDDRTYVFALGACARSRCLSALYVGRQIHARAVKHGLISDLLVSTTAIYFYGRSGSIRCARKMFDEMPMRNGVTWNALIAGYCSLKLSNNENAIEALKLFKGMLVDESGIELNNTTMVCVFSAALQVGLLEVGACLHGFIEKTISDPQSDVYIGTSLVDMYSKCGSLGSAWNVFQGIEAKNVLTWTAMTTALAFHGKGNEALEMLDEMKSHNVIPNAVTFTSLLSACCHAGLLKEGLHLFQNMEMKFGVKPCVQHYGCVVDLLGRAGHLREAYNIIRGMMIKPDPVLWRSLLGACRLHGDSEMGEKVGRILLRIQPESGSLGYGAPSEDYVSLSNVYALAGRWGDVGVVRDEMKMKGIETKPGHSAVS